MADERDSQVSLEERLRKVEFRRLEMGDVEPRGVRLESSWLLEHGSDVRVERIWQRLAPALSRGSRAARLRPALLVGAAAAVFALGLWAGRSSLPPAIVVANGEPPDSLLEPEPQARTDVARPTGRPADAPPAGHRGRPKLTRHLRSASAGRAPSETAAALEVLEPGVEEPSLGPVAAPPRWLTLANGGEYQLAFQAVDEAGGFDAVVRGATAEELMTLADVARAAGQPGRAVQALREVLARDPSDPNAPVAAMLLGNLLQRAGDYAGATEAYDLNRRLSPRGDFAEDALARQFDVALDKGDLARARALSAQYETEFPEGRRLGEIREQLKHAEGDAASKAAAGAARDGDKHGDAKAGGDEKSSDEPAEPSAEPQEDHDADVVAPHDSSKSKAEH